MGFLDFYEKLMQNVAKLLYFLERQYVTNIKRMQFDSICHILTI